MTRILVGHVTVSEPFESTELFEFAAWWRKHQIRPGTYAVHGEVQFHPTRITRLSVRFDTVVLDEYFASHFGGVPVGGDPCKRDVGKESTLSESCYDYDLSPEIIMHGQGEKFGGHFAFVPGAYGVARSTYIGRWEGRDGVPDGWLHNLRDVVPAPHSTVESWVEDWGKPWYERGRPAWVIGSTWAELVA